MPSNHLIACCPLSSCLQSFPASGSFQMHQLFASGDKSIGVSASVSVLPMNIQDWFPLGWISWISLLSKELSRVFSKTTVQKHQFFGAQFFFIVQLSHPYSMTTGETIALTRRTFVGKEMSLLFNVLCLGQWTLWNPGYRGCCDFTPHFHVTEITALPHNAWPHLIWPRSWGIWILKGWDKEYNRLTLFRLCLKFTVTKII